MDIKCCFFLILFTFFVNNRWWKKFILYRAQLKEREREKETMYIIYENCILKSKLIDLTYSMRSFFLLLNKIYLLFLLVSNSLRYCILGADIHLLIKLRNLKTKKEFYLWKIKLLPSFWNYSKTWGDDYCWLL